MIDLAPRNPYSLPLQSPVIAQAGLRGAGVERLAGLEGVGAIVSDTLLGRDETAAGWGETPAGLICPNGGRGIKRARRDLERWGRLSRPVIIALRAATSQQARDLLGELDPEAHPAIMLDLGEIAGAPATHEMVAAVRRDWRKPLLAELPVDGPPLPALLDALAEVDAIVLSRGGRAIGGDGAHGRLVGPAAHPTLLRAVQAVRDQLGDGGPAIVAGAASVTEARAMVAAGASAILLRAGLWRDPELASTLAAELPRN